MKIDTSKVFTADLYQVENRETNKNGTVRVICSEKPLVKDIIVVKISDYYYAHIREVNTIFKYKRMKYFVEKGEFDTPLLSIGPDVSKLTYIDNVKPMFTESGKTSARKLSKNAPKCAHDLEW